MPLQYETVAIPVTKGINVTTEARLLEPPNLLEAINARFGRGGGSMKRRGHLVTEVRGEEAIPPGWVPSNDNWLFGWGYQATGPIQNPLNRPAGTEGDILGVSPHPSAGRLYGMAQRDGESVVWTGHSLESYASNAQTAATFADAGVAVFPSSNAQPIAKTASSQTRPDVADNGVIKVVAWLDKTLTKIRYSVYNSVSAAPFITAATLDAVTPTEVRCIPLGRWVHMLVVDSNGNTLQCYTLNQDTPGITPVKRSMGQCDLHFDIWKIDETQAAMVKSNNTTKTLDVLYLNADGTPNLGTSLSYAFTTDPVSGTPVGSDCVAICVHPLTPTVVALAWQNQDGSATPAHYAAVVFGSFSLVPPISVGATARSKHISIAPKYLLDQAGNELFDVYWDADTVTGGICYRQRFGVSGATTYGPPSLLANHLLASQAFRVGDRTFIWTGHKALLQSTWVLCDESLRPVGKQDYITAAVESYANASSHLSSVNWISDSGGPTPTKNLTKFHYALPFNTRGPTTSTQTGVFAETQIRAGTLEFLPRLHSAQGGRALYFAGAQVWEYDGVAPVEQGFHYGPEIAPLTGSNQSVGGALTALGTYFYRVDLCHKNAQGEEVRSLSVLTNPLVLTGSNQTITFKIPTCVTRRPDSYFLIFRNAMISGIPTVNMWLLNSRDPSTTGNTGFHLNDPTQGTITFVDDGTVTDTAIQTNELHPAGAGGDTYLQPTSGPACEIIGSGQDRLWVAGGELLPGQIAPSRLFQPGDQPTFNAYLQIQVDRGAEPITAIGFVGEIAAFFRKNSTYILDSQGPDNSTNGVWAPVRLAVADLGALGQESIALVSSGLMFQSPTGFRLLGPGGGVQSIGQPVDQIARAFDVRSAVVINADQEVRWYGSTGTIVYNYLYDSWSTWTVTAAGAVRDYTTGLALVANSSGQLWHEDDTLFVDGDRPYTHRVRFPWLHAGALGDFQRVRKIEGVGKTDGLPHTVRMELFYDERDWPEEIFEWDLPETGVDNTDIWGGTSSGAFFSGGFYSGGFYEGVGTTWGEGVWGDTTSILAQTIHPTTWDWVRRPGRQKCAVISIAIDDAQTTGQGFTLNAICLELGKRPGLNRIPARGGTNIQR